MSRRSRRNPIRQTYAGLCSGSDGDEEYDEKEEVEIPSSRPKRKIKEDDDNEEHENEDDIESSSKSESDDSKGKSELDEDDKVEIEPENNNQQVDEEIESEENPNPAPRRSRRRRTASLKEAFELLRGGDINGFLDEWIIRRDLACAFNLLSGEFNSGHNKELMTALWHLHWAGDLQVVSLQKRRETGRCIACNRRRQLKYCIYNFGDRIDLPGYENESDEIEDDADDEGELENDDNENEPENNEAEDDRFLGIMGTDCYEVKLEPLMQLVNVCWQLTGNLDRDDFTEYAGQILSPVLQAVREVPARMKALYKRKRK